MLVKWGPGSQPVTETWRSLVDSWLPGIVNIAICKCNSLTYSSPLSGFYIIVLTQVDGSGQLVFQFISYENPDGEGSNGHCCDGRLIFCERGGGCDHYFVLCVDSQLGWGQLGKWKYNEQHHLYPLSITGKKAPVSAPLGGIPLGWFMTQSS